MSARKIIKNSIALIAMQLAGYVLPLLAIPKLATNLGVDSYGRYAYIFAMVSLISVVMDFGFDIYAPIYISKCKSKHLIKNFIGAVFALKIILFVCMTILFLSIALNYKMNAAEIINALLSILGATFLSFWFFQGIEVMAIITKIYLTTKIIYLFLVYILINDANDVHLALFANGFSQLLAATASMSLIVYLGYAPILPNKKYFLLIIKKTSTYFLSRVAVSAYTTMPIVALGYFSDAKQVAIYSAAEQLYRGMQGLFSAACQAVIPTMAKTKNIKLFLKILIILLALMFAVVFLAKYQAKEIVNLIFGDTFMESIDTFRFFLNIFVISSVSSFIGYPLLGAFGYGYFVNKGLVMVGILQISMLIIAIYVNELNINVIINLILICELIVIFQRMYYIYKYIPLSGYNRG